MPAYEFKDTIFIRRVTYFVGSREEFLHWLETNYGKKSTKGIPKDARGLSSYVVLPVPDAPDLKTRYYYIWLRHFDGSPFDISTVSHEAFHIASMIMDDLGVDTNEAAGAEPVAYYTDALVRQFLDYQRGVLP